MEITVGIDASNIRGGGGVTHLQGLLSSALPEVSGIRKVIVWGGRDTLEKLPERAWLEKSHEKSLDGSLLSRLAWQRLRLSTLAGKRCDVVFVPGGSYHGRFKPYVAMSQNLLPFSPDDCRRYGLRMKRIRLFLLRLAQSATFRKADGIVFLTEGARNCIEKRAGKVKGPVAVIPHGIGDSFRQEPRPQLAREEFSRNRPFRWVYVSVIERYKHQGRVVEAVAKLRSAGFPVNLDLVGPATKNNLVALKGMLSYFDPKGEFVRYLGPVSHEQLALHYLEADGFVFASSCENMPIILLEAMAAGLPIACSDRVPMPEVLGNAGVYFDPERPESIAAALRRLISDPELRANLAREAWEASLRYTWSRCANETFRFLASVCGRRRLPAVEGR